MASSRRLSRATRAVEAYQNAATTIGEITPGLSIFAITRGQFSMIDAILHTLDQLGPSALSVWTWTIAEYEIQAFTSLRNDDRITSGRLVIDSAARTKNSSLIQQWKSTFGPESVRYVLNHAKIATVDNGKLRVLLRGSMNLNHNPRFEQFDLTEGGPDFDMVREIEDELPILGDGATGTEVYAASKVAEAFDRETLDMFKGVKTWRK